jgi:quinolinate synthase
MNELENLAYVLENQPQGNEIFVDTNLRERALKPLTRMLEFKK